MTRHPTPTAPALAEGQTISELVVPVVDDALHDRVIPLAGMLADAWALPIRLVHVATPAAPTDDLDSLRADLQTWFPTIDIGATRLAGDDVDEAIASHLPASALLVLSTDHLDTEHVETVAGALLDRLELPVLLAGTHVTKAQLRDRELEGDVVVGVDGSAVAETGVDAAVALAKAVGHRLWLVQVVPEPAGDARSAPPDTRYLQRLAERHSAEIGTRWEVVHGDDPVRALEAFAARHDAGFLVAATHGRITTQRTTLVSTAAGLIARAERPVLVLRVPDAPAIAPT